MKSYTYEAAFSGTTEVAALMSLLAALIATGFEFTVLDDRGGSNCWLVIVKLRLQHDKPAQVLPFSQMWAWRQLTEREALSSVVA